ncbi:MAG: hypothetical protein RL322_1110 [Pseudomonadota bacterium]|jgi:hypothetical protein
MSLPIRTLFAATVLALSASQAYAQTYPDRPIISPCPAFALNFEQWFKL